MKAAVEIVGAARLDGGGSLAFEHGVMAATSPSGCRRFDATGLIALPGIVDVHGDAFERVLMPRPRVSFETDIALFETDRQLVANGITTAFHGVTVSWEPGLRSPESAETLVREWQRLRPDFLCDTRLHVRWETFALDAMDTISGWLALDPAPILAFNDHTTSEVTDGRIPRKEMRILERTGLDADAYYALQDAVWARRDEVPTAMEALARHAAGLGVVVLAHDERTPDSRVEFRALGANASEFPMNAETAQAARDAGEHTVFGAPNVVRGKSHNNALNATDAIATGLCTVLASDYYYPAPLLAPFLLEQRGTLPLAEAWKLVSQNPAEVAALNDRGTLEPGKRADVVLVDATRPGRPQVRATFVEGRCVYSSGDSRWI